MISTSRILGIAFLFQIGLSIMGNAILFVGYTYIFIANPKQRPMCLIVTHLSVVHLLLVCTAGVPGVAEILGYRVLINDIMCKINTYLHRVSRALSICLTSLLSILQTITISPASSYWAVFKTKNLLYIIYSFFFVWILNLLICSNMIISMTAPKSGNISKVIAKSCFILSMNDFIKWFFLMFLVLRDITFLGSMGWTSGYMTLHLYRHHKRTQHLRRSTTPFKMNHEMRATKKIIILTLCFISLYGINMILSINIGYFSKTEPVILQIEQLVAASFALLSPVVFLSNNSQLHIFWASVFEKIRNLQNRGTNAMQMPCKC
ncbi:vomeronasal 1 receptor cavPorV1R603 [Cavia porcellus]|uniref:vomeronasal 1 receptor cavPorV1R603 n=1 Tax=Cavia porcellus TaxID=10141 RepID=UPI0001CF73F8|nr:vomeronasal 1 receptor cavPorV1R603 [Cavia porcellus]